MCAPGDLESQPFGRLSGALVHDVDTAPAAPQVRQEDHGAPHQGPAWRPMGGVRRPDSDPNSTLTLTLLMARSGPVTSSCWLLFSANKICYWWRSAFAAFCVSPVSIGMSSQNLGGPSCVGIQPPTSHNRNRRSTPPGDAPSFHQGPRFHDFPHS